MAAHHLSVPLGRPSRTASVGITGNMQQENYPTIAFMQSILRVTL